MFQRGRSPDLQFNPDELLYRRFKDMTYTEDHPPAVDIPALLRTSLNFNPYPSANRGRYSSRYDVLIAGSQYDWGVYAFPVSAVPSQCVGGDKKTYQFTVKHTPEVKNYAHSEIQTILLGAFLGKQPPHSVKDLVRRSLEPGVTIVRKPRIGEWLAWVKRRVGL